MYSGYRIKINGIIVSNDFISQGSYSSKRVRRVLEEYYDANGVLHEELSARETMEISFAIRERNMHEQAYLNPLFQKHENISVEYWDDISAEYKTSTFKMENPVFAHRNTRNGAISYAKTSIVLKEY